MVSARVSWQQGLKKNYSKIRSCRYPFDLELHVCTVPYQEMEPRPDPPPPKAREWSKRTCFSFRSSSGCSDRIWDIFISLNLSYQDEDAGVFKFSVALKLATPETFSLSLFSTKSSKLQFCRGSPRRKFLSYRNFKNTSVFVMKRRIQ